MSKLIMMKGLPASGKSTKAQELITQGSWVRLNKDLIRTMLHFDKFTGRNEGLTIEAQKTLARHYLSKNISVVVDDTNLGDKHKESWSGIAKETESKFEIVEMDTSLEECLERDEKRDPRVGESVIKGMALQYGYFQPKKGIVLCDIDGTIADLTHRLKYARGEEKNWDTFFSKLYGDTPRTEIIDQVNEMHLQGYDIVFVTARPEQYRAFTLDWMKTKAKIPFTPYTMVMRRSHDKRQDMDVKRGIYDLYFKKYNVVKVFDDRPSVIRMWKEEGLEVIDVGEGIEF